jgi:actin cytoskeleton-regulatory complex protein SLA1
VQKWQTSDIETTRVEKSKHVHIEIGGAAPISLHFHAGSKDVADAILAKLQDARLPEEPSALELTAESLPERPRSTGQKSVHFDQSEPEIIPPREADGESEPDDEHHDGYDDAEGERAVVLYDFKADGEDEMTVSEGETLFVLERDTDEWWKCRNRDGAEGVVPANYLEVGSQHIVRCGANILMFSLSARART